VAKSYFCVRTLVLNGFIKKTKGIKTEPNPELLETSSSHEAKKSICLTLLPSHSVHVSIKALPLLTYYRISK